MLKPIRSLSFSFVLFVSTATWCQKDPSLWTVSDALQSFDDSAFIDFHLNYFSEENFEDVMMGNSVYFKDGGSVFMEHLDTVYDRSMSIAYSENFDEIGYILLMYHVAHKKKNTMVFVLQAGDHCCDWIEKVAVYEFKKGTWFQKENQKVYPDISWELFYDTAPTDTSRYSFLNEPPPYRIWENEGVFELELSYDLIALGYDNGELFLQQQGKDPQKVFLIWNEKKARFETHFTETSN